MGLPLLFSLGLVTVLVSNFVWLYWYYPVLGHDNSFGIATLFELRTAWDRFGRLDVDFSPFRCLGLPHFSNPNTIIFSLYHAFALFLREYHAIVLFVLIVALVSYVGTYLYCRSLRLSPRLAVLLATGWGLQAWVASRLLVGHTGFVQLLLFPLFMWILTTRARADWKLLGLVAFAWAHFVYGAGYYILLMGVPSLLLAAWLTDFLHGRPEDSAGPSDTRLRRALWRLLPTGGLAALATFPKILGVLNFTSLFPREAKFMTAAEAANQKIPQAALLDVPTWSAFKYVLGNFFYPFPYEIRNTTGWWYGNWESFQFLLPGAVYLAAWLLWRHRARLPVGRFVGSFVGLLAIGTVLSSGALAPVFSQLPLYKSLHVNPRWNALLILPFFVWIVTLLVQSERARAEGSSPTLESWLTPSWTLVMLGLLVMPPMLLMDPQDLQINYPDRAGIDVNQGRLAFCYEPIFGYGLENFPLQKKAPPGQTPNWMGDTYADPRCYLKSRGCEPGRLFDKNNPQDAADLQSLLSYSLVDDYAPVRYGKPFALFVYALLFAGAWVGLWRIGRELGDELRPVP